MSNIKASTLPPPVLTKRSITTLCAGFVAGFCRHGDKGKKSHEMCAILEADSRPEAPVLNCEPNLLCLQPRLPSNGSVFDDDGPGNLSSVGARHDNDHSMALPSGKNGRFCTDLNSQRQRHLHFTHYGRDPL